MNRRRPLLLAGFAVAGLPAAARDCAAPLTPGIYARWNCKIDLLRVTRSFRITDFDRIVAPPIGVDPGVALPPADGEARKAKDGHLSARAGWLSLHVGEAKKIATTCS